jgi:hypothetical protein
LPLNPITENLWYTKEDNKNMRMVISANTKHPIVWTLTKLENASPLGIQTLTFYQNYWNEHTDYIEKDSNGNIVGMWADYFSSEITPTNPSTPIPTPSSITARILASTSTIKVGGSYKNLTVNLFNDSNEDITTEYSDATISWTCSTDDEDWTDKVTWRDGTEFNQKKLKFPSDSSVLNKILSIKCVITIEDETIESEVLQLELIE